MNRILISFFSILVGSALPALAAEPLCSIARPGALLAAKARLAAGDTALRPALDKLIADADAALKVAPVSVTQKTKLDPAATGMTT